MAESSVSLPEGKTKANHGAMESTALFLTELSFSKQATRVIRSKQSKKPKKKRGRGMLRSPNSSHT